MTKEQFLNHLEEGRTPEWLIKQWPRSVRSLLRAHPELLKYYPNASEEKNY